MKVIAIILAAGEGRRMGGPKPLLRLGDGTLLTHVVDRLWRPGVQGVCAVIGHEAERVRAEAEAAGIAVVDNPDYREGMLSSVRCGIAYATEQGADAALVHPVDHPLIAPATVDRVVAALEAGATIAVPTWEGRRGHPAGWSRRVWAALEAAPPELGARAVLADHPEWVVHVEGDEGCRRGLNLREEYDRLVREWA